MSWVLAYLLLSVVVAFLGRERRPGFAGWLILALFLTPVVGLAIFLVTQTTLIPVAPDERKIALTRADAPNDLCPKCRRKLKHPDVEV